MDTRILLVGIILAGTGTLFVSSRLRVDLVAVLAGPALAWLRLITHVDALSGVASNAVIAMASVMILVYGIERTGVTSRLASAITRNAGSGERRINTT